MQTSRRLDDDRCYRIACSRDGRFDGMFVTAVLTTGIYCRPSCPALTPLRRNVGFYNTPASAQEAGFRACKRCRPDAAPGSPEWDGRADVVARAVRLIGDGIVEREGVQGVARRVGYSPRHLCRLMVDEVGTGPLRLAMAHRIQAARTLLETTDLPVTDVAWASGFGSIRQFNDLVRSVYASTPGELRARAAGAGCAVSGGQHPGSAPAVSAVPADRPVGATVIRARLAYRPPLDVAHLLSFLGARAIPRVESFDGNTFTTSMRLPRGFGVASVYAAGPGTAAAVPGVAVPVAAVPGAGAQRSKQTLAARPFLECELRLDDVRDFATAISRLRRLLDLDADPVAVAESLAACPLLAPEVAAAPGRRMPGTAEPFELAVRAVVGQQVSVASARVTNGRLAELFGDLLPSPHGGVDLAFPSTEAIAHADPARVPMPRSRAEALRELAEAVAGERVDLHPGADRDRTEAALVGLRGIGPWTAAYIRMRGLGDPDVLPPGDAAIRRALLQLRLANPAGAGVRAGGRTDGGGTHGPGDNGSWRPWRSYATAHLWAIRPPSRQGAQT